LRASSPPYDVISQEERAVLAARDPHNVVRLILPEGDGDAKYANAAALLARWRDEGALVRDSSPAFYRYEQTFLPPGSSDHSKRITRRGFLALVRVVPFADRVVLPHERTLSGPKEDRLKLFRATGTNLSPGFMLYSDPRGDLKAPLDEADELARFSTPDGVEHEWGEVTGWEPPTRLAYVWHIAQDRADATDVEIRFSRQGDASTRIDIEHVGWQRLGAAAEERRAQNRGGWDALVREFVAATAKGDG